MNGAGGVYFFHKSQSFILVCDSHIGQKITSSQKIARETNVETLIIRTTHDYTLGICRNERHVCIWNGITSPCIL
jgi:hypothetical protein